MTTAVLSPSTPVTRSGEVDSRAAYAGFGFAYVFGHGSAALSRGADPLVDLPGWVPTALLATGLAAGTVFATVAAMRAQRGANDQDVRSGQLLGVSWVSAFVALFMIITAVTSIVDAPGLSSVLWPTGSGLVVGLLYLGEGAARRNVLHYALGTWLALTSTAAVFLGTPGLFWVLAVAGGGAFVAASLLERRRLAAPVR